MAESTDDAHPDRTGYDSESVLSNKWAAITEYLRRTSTEGLAQAEATKLRLVSRIGALSPATTEAEAGSLGGRGNKSLTGTGSALSPNRMSEARKIAANPDVVDDVIEKSTDADPPTDSRQCLFGARTSTTVNRSSAAQLSS